MTEEIMGCPFCGGSRIKAHYIRDGRSIGCADCGATLHAFNGPYDITRRLVALWNRRTLPAAPPAAWLEAMARAMTEIVIEEADDRMLGPEVKVDSVGALRIAQAAYAALARKMGDGDAE